MAWFKKTRKPMAAAAKEKPSRVPEGLWVKCPDCAQVIYNKDLHGDISVCPKCGHHFRINAVERLRMLFDGAWTEYDTDLVSTDPLGFTDTKPYKSRLKAGIESTGMKDAVLVGSGTIDGIDAIVAAMEYGFIGGSLGGVVGGRGDDGRRAIADADGEDFRRAREARSRAPAVHRRAHRSNDGRRHGELRDARRFEHRRAEGADRLRRAPRHRTDDPPEV